MWLNYDSKFWAEHIMNMIKVILFESNACFKLTEPKMETEIKQNRTFFMFRCKVQARLGSVLWQQLVKQ